MSFQTHHGNLKEAKGSASSLNFETYTKREHEEFKRIWIGFYCSSCSLRCFCIALLMLYLYISLKIKKSAFPAYNNFCFEKYAYCHYLVSPDVFLSGLSWFYHNTSLHSTGSLRFIPSFFCCRFVFACLFCFVFAIRNDIVSLTSFSVCLLLVYRKSPDFMC